MYCERMDLSGAQVALEDSLNTISNRNGYYDLGMQYVNFLNDYDTMALGIDNTFKPSSNEIFGPQITVIPPQSENEIFDSQVSTEANFQDDNVNVVGAGPLPVDFERPSIQERNCNGITDFTKRRNWPQRIIEEIKDFLHILTPDGRIIFASSSSEDLTGYTSEELKGRFIFDFIHPDDSGLFLRELNESIATGNLFKLYYRFSRKDRTHIIFESHGHPHLGPLNGKDSNTNIQSTCRGYFMMARPYLTKNAALLDSILEHKIENLRLLKRIDDLRKEEIEEEEEYQRKWSSQPTKSENNSESTVGSNSTVQNQLNKTLAANNSDALSMPPPAKPMNAPLTKKALEESSASLKPYSIKDKMARYEGFTPVESVEMLTGLRYREGERSFGISTGAHSPILIKGDAGISIPLDKEVRNDKKRKIKLLDEYVCTDCGTLDSPEWRKGPSGPKTLCNACGLRWAKREKKNPLKCKNTPSNTRLPENRNIRW